MTMSAPEEPSRSGSRVALTIVGAVVVLLGVAGLLAGGPLVAMHETQRDASGYYASGAHAIATPTHALVSDTLDIGTDGPDWLFSEGRLGTVRVTATGSAASPIFVGVARRVAVEAYLRDVARDEVTDFHLDPFSVDLERGAGTKTPLPPAQQSFWASSSTGTGNQKIEWPVQQGDWAFVVMNADGGAGVATDLSVGGKLHLLFTLGVILLATGGVLILGGAGIFFASRSRHDALAASVPPEPASA